jgi:fructokinase
MKPRLLGVGELLWDLLPGNPQMGGAPANFACHAAALGADAAVISRVGNDALGMDLVTRLIALGVSTGLVQTDREVPSGSVDVEVQDCGQPRFTIHEGVAWDRLTTSDAAMSAAAMADAVCFGTLAQRAEPSRSTIRALLGAVRPDAFRILDVNLRQHFYSREILESSLALANVLKINDAELPILGAWVGPADSPRAVMERLADCFGLSVVAYTRGEHGSLLWAGGNWSDHPGIPTRVVDTVGAGDAFTAALTLGLLAGWDLDTVNQRANAVASEVASQSGATPPLSAALRRSFQGYQG